MRVPMVSHAQVQILREGVVEPVLAPDALPADLVPTTPFDAASIRAGLPAPGRFTMEDFAWIPRPSRMTGRARTTPVAGPIDCARRSPWRSRFGGAAGDDATPVAVSGA